MADQSPLSRWSRQPILKNLKFRLSIDGPHLPSDQQVTLQGDRQQLDLLCDVVDAYIQQTLSLSSSQFQVTFGQDVPPIRMDQASSTESISATASSLEQMLPEEGRSLVPPSSISNQRSIRPSMPTAGALSQTQGIGIVIPSTLALLPCGKLKHELWWGALTTQPPRQSTIISTIELFDLANALGQYKSDYLALSDQKRSRGQHRVWMQAAAMVVLVVGTTSVLVPAILNQPNFSPLSSESASDEEPQDASENQSSAVPASPDDINTDDRLDSVQSRADAANRARQRTQDEDDALLDEFDRPSASAANGTDSSQENQPSSNGGSENADANNTGRSPSRSNRNPDRAIPPELAAIPPVEQRLSEAEGAIARAREEGNAGVSASSRSQADRPSVQSSSEFALPSADVSAESAAAPQPSDDGAPSAGLTQVEEVRAYFQQSWQPPDTLGRAIEYQLTLNSNGTLAQVNPLGQTARLYAAQANIPEIGAPFVSPLDSDAQPIIRLVLQPNGQVRAFLEAWN
jgi:hypothetical protein